MTRLAPLIREEKVRRRADVPRAAEVRPEENAVLARIAALQRASGNRAVSHLLRDAAPSSAPMFGGPLSGLPPSLNLPADYIEKQNVEIERKIADYLERERPRIQGRILLGHSIAELVDQVRTNVPEALRLAPAQVAAAIRKHFAPLSITEHRKPDDTQGQKSELVARLRNTMSKIPTELGIENERGWAKVTMSGVEAGVKSGDAEASLEVGWDKTIGAATEVAAGPGKIKFSASIAPPEKSGDPVKWEMSLAFVQGGGGAAGAEKLAEVVGKGEAGIRSLIEEARKGGDASPGKIKEAFAPVKGAIDALSKLIGAEGVTIGVSVEGDGPDVRLQATIKVSF